MVGHRVFEQRLQGIELSQAWPLARQQNLSISKSRAHPTQLFKATKRAAVLIEKKADVQVSQSLETRCQHKAKLHQLPLHASKGCSHLHGQRQRVFLSRSVPTG